MTLKSDNWVALASIKSFNGVAKASVKSKNWVLLPWGNGLLNSLISYYKMDWDWNDATATNDITPSNVSWVTGKINNGGSFNVTNSQFRTPNITLPNGSSPYSINFRVKLNAEITTWTRHFTFLWADATLEDTVYYLNYQYNWGTRRLSYEHYYNWPETYYAVRSNQTLWTTNWTMITMVYTGTAMTLYVNWSQVATGGGSGTYWISAVATYQKGLTIGAQYVLSAYWSRANAIFDEIAYYNRAIIWTDITNLYNSWAWLPYGSFTS